MITFYFMHIASFLSRVSGDGPNIVGCGSSLKKRWVLEVLGGGKRFIKWVLGVILLIS
ncbi:hypothetical protein NIES39_G01020 [Arthrospira platensis NIES-39]|nr:hypothetical protein NIES39_G01020 [Arthrospira platensis NIES-39]